MKILPKKAWFSYKTTDGTQKELDHEIVKLMAGISYKIVNQWVNLSSSSRVIEFEFVPMKSPSIIAPAESRLVVPVMPQ